MVRILIFKAVKIISEKTLKSFWRKYPDAQNPLETWCSLIKHSDWQSPQDVLNDFPGVRIIPNSRVIFNIKENHYRLVTYVRYTAKKVYIRFIGSHGDYDQINAEEI
ncbi:MAG: toxin RelE [bacterium]|nr:MAG: toxin RelE [bacterium]